MTWWTFLGLLTVFTSNPVTVNQLQIRSSEWIVVGTVTNLQVGKVRVDMARTIHLRGDQSIGETVTIESLADSGAKEQMVYAFPVTVSDRDQLRITNPKNVPRNLVYPATDAVIDRIKSLLQRPAVAP